LHDDAAAGAGGSGHEGLVEGRPDDDIADQVAVGRVGLAAGREQSAGDRGTEERRGRRARGREQELGTAERGRTSGKLPLSVRTLDGIT